MSLNFLDRVAASRRRPRPVFKAFRTKLILNGDARRVFFPVTDRVLLAYEPERARLAIKALPQDVYEHEGWQAFHIEPQPGENDTYQVEWRAFWDHQVGLAGGRPIVRGVEGVEQLDNDVIAFALY